MEGGGVRVPTEDEPHHHPKVEMHKGDAFPEKRVVVDKEGPFLCDNMDDNLRTRYDECFCPVQRHRQHLRRLRTRGQG